MNPLWIVLFGLLGSAVVEVVRLVAIYEAGKTLPARYKKVGFWIVRSLLAITGGGLAVAYDIQSPILAVHIGASTPIIIETFSRRLPGD
ncbi:hypothetical protein BH23PLA1_BH23PLA1_00230 [soil metagenome]